MIHCRPAIVMWMQQNHHHHFFDTWCDFLCFLEASLPLLAFVADLILSSRLGLSDRGTTAELEKARWSHSNGARTGLLDRNIPELPLLPLCGLEWNRVYFPAEWSPKNAIGNNNNNLAHSRIQNATKHSTLSTLRVITQTPTRAGNTEVCREAQSAIKISQLTYVLRRQTEAAMNWMHPRAAYSLLCTSQNRLVQRLHHSRKCTLKNAVTKILDNTLAKRNWTGNCGGTYNELQPAEDKPPASRKHAGISSVPRSLPTFLPESCLLSLCSQGGKGTLKIRNPWSSNFFPGVRSSAPIRFPETLDPLVHHRRCQMHLWDLWLKLRTCEIYLATTTGDAGRAHVAHPVWRIVRHGQKLLQLPSAIAVGPVVSLRSTLGLGFRVWGTSYPTRIVSSLRLPAWIVQTKYACQCVCGFFYMVLTFDSKTTYNFF